MRLPRLCIGLVLSFVVTAWAIVMRISSIKMQLQIIRNKTRLS